ncbi:MAG: hypothetical protein PHI12_09030 [Dehalococcoidales bacterium]|nr:hypothetical protein [Dehalococcoidales bacterium]
MKSLIEKATMDALPHNMYAELSRWKDVIEGFRGDLGKLKKEMTFR